LSQVTFLRLKIAGALPQILLGRLTSGPLCGGGEEEAKREGRGKEQLGRNDEKGKLATLQASNKECNFVNFTSFNIEKVEDCRYFMLEFRF